MCPRWLLALLAIVLMPHGLCAHSIGMEWKQIDQSIAVEAFFDDNTPAREARVQMLDDEKNVVAAATTDAHGKCNLRATIPGQYTLVVDAGAGHRKQLAIRVVGTLPPSPTGPVGEPVATGAGTSGDHRDDFTRFPWERVAIGLGVIALLTGIWWLARKHSP